VIHYEDMNFIILDQDRVKLWAFVVWVMNFKCNDIVS